MKPILTLLTICLMAATLPLEAQEAAPTKKRKNAPLNEVKGPVAGKVYIVTPEKSRFTVRLDQPVIAADKTNKVVAFHLAEGAKITIDGTEGKIEGLQKGMKVSVMPSAADPGKAEKVEATKAAVEEKKTADTEE